jgi:hypothetical protein
MCPVPSGTYGPKLLVAVVTEVVHKFGHGGSGIRRVARREAEVEEEIRVPLSQTRLGSRARNTPSRSMAMTFSESMFRPQKDVVMRLAWCHGAS